MASYTTVQGEVLDLDRLSEPEFEFFNRCYRAYLSDTAWGEFANLAERSENPVIASAGGLITPAVREHPLYRAVRDLEDRLGIRQGKLLADPSIDLSREPLTDTLAPAHSVASTS